jgi:pimeloyl-ACP methyl ester carboxylesterase
VTIAVQQFETKKNFRFQIGQLLKTLLSKFKIVVLNFCAKKFFDSNQKQTNFMLKITIIFEIFYHIYYQFPLFRVYSDLGGRFPSDLVLHTIKCPVLLINGGNDRFVMDPKLIQEKIPHALLEIHAQGPHELHIKYPKWFAMKFMHFLKTNQSVKK